MAQATTYSTNELKESNRWARSATHPARWLSQHQLFHREPLMSDPNRNFSETLFRLYPDFIPTQALYIDLEGRKRGSEDILSFYRPALPGSVRFSWITRSESDGIDLNAMKAHLDSIGVTAPKWVVVYSAGQSSPDERSRVTDLLGQDPFPDSEWINLLHIVQQCPEIKRSIRDHRHGWYGTDQIRVRYSLEALEWEFGIERPIELRSHSNRYRDLNGASGQMEVLSIANRLIQGTASEDEELCLKGYCELDVRSMYEISYASEQVFFNKIERSVRRKVRP